ncbi:MAG: CDP-diacylglycerol--glycerol-3-phosphate 3-phosphatidyltransferase [Planctomycetota bacterium]|jgi:CDP-diacylglycerol--glycerol-3-phosphate 3-phosphatidyltransferase
MSNPEQTAEDLPRASASSGTRRGEGVFAHWPNRITMMRFVGSLLLFVLMALEGFVVPERKTYIGIAFWLFLIIALSDALDGYLARKGNVVTAFGRIADPFVDKVLVLGTMIFLAVMPWSAQYFPAWIVVAVLAREFLVTGIRGYVESLGLEFGADGFGKIKMVMQCIAIGIVLGQHALPWPQILKDAYHVLAHVFVWATLISTIGSGLTYISKTRKLLSKSVSGGA